MSGPGRSRRPDGQPVCGAADISYYDTDVRGDAASVAGYLRDAYGVERQSLALLDAATSCESDPRLKEIYRRHAIETHGHLDRVGSLLASRGLTPSLVSEMREQLSGDALRLAIAAQSAKSDRLVAAVYAFEHYEIATYQVLGRVARRTYDGEAASLCEQILSEEVGTAEAIHASLDVATDAIGTRP